LGGNRVNRSLQDLPPLVFTFFFLQTIHSPTTPPFFVFGGGGVPIANPDQHTDYFDCAFCGLPQFLQQSAGVVP